MKYRKKPVVIDAVQWLPAAPEPAPEWYCVALDDKIIQVHGEVLVILTLEGPLTAQSGDWIIRGIKGEIYPCKPDIFEATYEKADDLIP